MLSDALIGSTCVKYCIIVLCLSSLIHLRHYVSARLDFSIYKQLLSHCRECLPRNRISQSPRFLYDIVIRDFGQYVPVELLSDHTKTQYHHILHPIRYSNSSVIIHVK